MHRQIDNEIEDLRLKSANEKTSKARQPSNSSREPSLIASPVITDQPPNPKPNSNFVSTKTQSNKLKEKEKEKGKDQDKQSAVAAATHPEPSTSNTEEGVGDEQIRKPLNKAQMKRMYEEHASWLELGRIRNEDEILRLSEKHHVERVGSVKWDLDEVRRERGELERESERGREVRGEGGRRWYGVWRG